MKILVAIFALAAFVAHTSAAVLPELLDSNVTVESLLIKEKLAVYESENVQNTDNIVSHSRQRRFTCDAFSFSSKWVTPNHTACALKCVGMGRKGGHCENNNCVCRDDRYIG